ncbi:SDR family NAD(P)-dependent oxidoreductase [Acetobacter estunensis]|uniref:SDR family NAD(P)-dependent oxidoreductase n=1 Tax=Acetobacter estunensis TaxID=104097 RepID=A0A967EHV3_9PROT|nr:SDR family NAD(P)-dependent oxidoreductase [Acetobacter estunensis]
MDIPLNDTAANVNRNVSRPPPPPRHAAGVTPACVLITGASGGIGHELAVRYARPGCTLILWGRDKSRLQATAAACEARGARTHLRALDLSDGEAAITAFREDDTSTPFDTVILCAGLSDMKRQADRTERAEDVLRLALVNYATPAALTMAAAERMQARNGGAICLIGSVAAFHDLPFAAGYGGSKAGLARFASSARIALAPLGVRVTLVAPGFVDTPMSQRIIGPRPFLVSPARAARHIMAAIARNQGECVFPWPFRVLRLIDRLTPRPLRDRIMARIDADQKPTA